MHQLIQGGGGGGGGSSSGDGAGFGPQSISNIAW
jgi:hypothetical protein